MRQILHILLWGKEIGILEWKPRLGRSFFTYNPVYLANGGVSPFPLIAPIENALYRSFGSEDERIYQHLPAFLADSLPDDWGNMLFERWRIDQHLSSSEVTPLDKLTFIGKRGMGALEFEPDTSPEPYLQSVNIGDLAALAHRIFQERENSKILPDEMLTKQLLIAVGTSAGGRQPKAIVALNRETGEIRSGQIAGLEGYDYYILKFGDKERSSAELEMTYYQMAIDAGINMMPCRLIEVEDEKHFMTQRFDRVNGEKLHLQTLAAIDPDADSYEKLLLVCRRLHLSDSDADQLFRRLLFNYLANNTDDHRKNVSFLMNINGEWRLAPAYDLTFIYNYGGYQPETMHCMMMRGKYRDWTITDILNFAQDNGIKNPQKILNEVALAISNFRNIAERYGVKREWIGRVESCLNMHLREWGFATVENQENWVTPKGKQVSNIFLEQAYKGNIHLYATIDGKLRKYIFRPATAEYQYMKEHGIDHIPYEKLRQWICEYMDK